MGATGLKVALLASTNSPELTAALGGRLCYSDSHVDELCEAVKGSEEKFVDRLVGMGHLSPIEHASFTFGIEGVSRALLAQITRHRIASFSVQSQRYVKKDELNYIVPKSIRALGEEACAEYAEQMQAVSGFYDRWQALGVPAEDARFVLPNAAETRMIVTMNARELLHFFALRCCERAQWEIRDLAWTMLGIARREAPALFKSAGPGCLLGGCPEGRMSCGRAAQVKGYSGALDEYLHTAPSDDMITGYILTNND